MYRRKRLPLWCGIIIATSWFPLMGYSSNISRESSQLGTEQIILAETQNGRQTSVCSVGHTPDCFITHAEDALPEIHAEKSRDFARLFLAVTQAEIHQKTRALNVINAIKDPFLQHISLISIAKLEAQASNPDQSTSTALRILQYAGKSPQAYVNTWLSSLLAEVFAELENYPQAQSLIDSALETLVLVRSYNTRTELFSLIGKAQHLIGDQSNAQISIHNAIDESSKITDSYLKALALTHVGLAQFELGQTSNSAATLLLAKQNAEKSSPKSRIVALAFLAMAKAETNQINSARNIIHETSNAAIRLENPYYRALACAFIAQAIFIAEQKLS